VTEQNLRQANEEARKAWDANAPFWDQRMGEGNDFVEILEWPAIERLLAPQPGWRVLDVACGNGLTSRRLAALGAEVVAFDFSAQQIAHARARTPGGEQRITYHVLDATDQAALLALGEGRFDAALCNMALMDMAEIEPLFRALARLLRPGGRFIFSITHPCFNTASTVRVAEMEDREGQIVTTYSVKVGRYLTPTIAHGLAVIGQLTPQPYFDRPLALLLAPAFAAGFVLDGLEERSFPTGHPSGSLPLGWSGHYHEIPPVLVARLRLLRE
jgi:2-polyprenyl-3-methyl-5-hydroxy-6-metoxy-1,4-benzoquinol methylase